MLSLTHQTEITLPEKPSNYTARILAKLLGLRPAGREKQILGKRDREREREIEGKDVKDFHTDLNCFGKGEAEYQSLIIEFCQIMLGEGT